MQNQIEHKPTSGRTPRGKIRQDNQPDALTPLHCRGESEKTLVTVDGAFSPRPPDFSRIPTTTRARRGTVPHQSHRPPRKKKPPPKINSNPTEPRWGGADMARPTWLLNPSCCCCWDCCCADAGVPGCDCSGRGDDAGELRELPEGPPPGCIVAASPGVPGWRGSL